MKRIATAPEALKIVKTPGVCGGAARVQSTRIPVWGLVKARREGCTDEQLFEMYPALSADDLSHAWKYAELHADEISGDIQRNEEA